MVSDNGQFDSSMTKFGIEVGQFIPNSSKLWARVTWRNGKNGWLPSIADLHRIAFYLAACEDMKYAKPHEEGAEIIFRYMLAAYADCKRRAAKFTPDDVAGIEEACRASYERLEKEFKVPTRNAQGEILRTNGAFQAQAEAIADAMPQPSLF